MGVVPPGRVGPVILAYPRINDLCPITSCPAHPGAQSSRVTNHLRESHQITEDQVKWQCTKCMRSWPTIRGVAAHFKKCKTPAPTANQSGQGNDVTEEITRDTDRVTDDTEITTNDTNIATGTESATTQDVSETERGPVTEMATTQDVSETNRGSVTERVTDTTQRCPDTNQASG